MRFLFLLLFSTPALAQETNNLGPLNYVEPIDGVYINEHLGCDHDTIAQIHRNARFELTDSSSYNYTFQPGNATYLELITKTKNCTCKDCQRLHRYIIDISAMPETMELALDPSNLTEIWWNSWRMPTKENLRSGMLKVTGKQVSLQLLQYFDKASSILEPAAELHVTLKE